MHYQALTNPALLLDSYKLGHAAQYPEGTTLVYSNFTPRSARWASVDLPTPFFDQRTVVCGIPAAMQEMADRWTDGFFKRRWSDIHAEIDNRVKPFVGPNGFDCDRLKQLHHRQSLPLRVLALDEGSAVKPGIPVLVLYNTDPDFYWLPNYLETYLSAQLWKPMTVATIARVYRRIFDHYAELSGTPKDFVQWQAHDFSVRGMSGIEDAARSGIGHLMYFTGTDNIPAVEFAEKYYDVSDTAIIGGSVPATEHSVMMTDGVDQEFETFRRLITDVYPRGIVSIVSDTWDLWRVLDDYAPRLRQDILDRKPDDYGMAKVVFRPDSGDPVDIICGTKDEQGAVDRLWDTFGGTLTDKGYKLLNPRVGLIYGDSITPARAIAICTRLMENGYASGNVVFGIGSYTYQHITRDTLGFALKSVYAEVNGQSRNLYKEPKTDKSRDKVSAKGRLRVEIENGDYVLHQEQPNFLGGELRTVFNDGKIPSKPNLSAVRSYAAQSL